MRNLGPIIVRAADARLNPVGMVDPVDVDLEVGRTAGRHPDVDVENLLPGLDPAVADAEINLPWDSRPGVGVAGEFINPVVGETVALSIPGIPEERVEPVVVILAGGGGVDVDHPDPRSVVQCRRGAGGGDDISECRQRDFERGEERPDDGVGVGGFERGQQLGDVCLVAGDGVNDLPGGVEEDNIVRTRRQPG